VAFTFFVTKNSKQKKCVRCVCFAKNRLLFAKSQKLAFGFEQTDFLRFVPPIFLTLTSQGGNHGIAKGNGLKRSQKFVFAEISDRLRLIEAYLNICQPPKEME